MKKTFITIGLVTIVCILGNSISFQLHEVHSVENIILNSAKEISAGSQHACALTTNNLVMCWGESTVLGIANPERPQNPAFPTLVSGLNTQVKQIASGLNHICVLTVDGDVKCWGRNEDGELGNGSFTPSSMPVDVRGLNAKVEEIAVGSQHTCARTVNGAVKCWGRNDIGQLGGGGTARNEWLPTEVQKLTTGVSKISAGNDVTCAIDKTNKVLCWGDLRAIEDGDCGGYKRAPIEMCNLNEDGEIDPDKVNIADIAVGYDHGCAVLAKSRKVKCWGQNAEGQLGNGLNASSKAIGVVGLSNVASIQAGAKQSCAILNNGTTKCWGKNLNGQLGDGTTINKNTPSEVKVQNISKLSIGRFQNDLGEASKAQGGFACAITGNENTLKCWGNNTSGTLGNGRREHSITPITVKGFEGSPPTPTPAPTTKARSIYIPVNFNQVFIAPPPDLTPPDPGRFFEGPEEFEPNDTIEQANGPLLFGREYIASPADRVDIFSFDVINNDNIQIITNGNSCPRLRVQLAYQDSTVIVADDSILRGSIIFHAEKAGRYYILIDNGLNCPQTTPYTLRVSL